MASITTTATLVLWDEAALEIVGAYRLADVRRVREQRGLGGLYSASLFAFSAHSADWLDQTVELGRSFVQPRYWGSRSLDYLWQGIGAYLRSYPHVRYVTGPVSLSAQLPEDARGWIVETHRHYFRDGGAHALARNPFVAPQALCDEVFIGLSGRSLKEGLAWMKTKLDALGCELPILYRQYVDLCEQDGVILMDFGVDPAFGHCVDGLIRIDLTRLKPHKRARYLGGAQATTTPLHVTTQAA